MPLRSKVAVFKFALSNSVGSGKTLTACVIGSTRTIAFSPPSVTHAARSGPTITPCGAESPPSDICTVFFVFGSSSPSAPCDCAVYQTPPSGAGATSCGCAPEGTAKYRTSAARAELHNKAATKNAKIGRCRCIPNLLFGCIVTLAPALGRSIVGGLRIHPVCRIRGLDLFPERRARLQVVHQKFRRGESSRAMRRGGDHQNDRLARRETAVAMDDRDAHQRPARERLADMPLDFRFRHAGVVFERERRDGLAFLRAATDAGELHEGADIAAPTRQLRRFCCGIEQLTLQADGDVGLHGA